LASKLEEPLETTRESSTEGGREEKIKGCV
jgi:hypothetical protein